MKFIVKDMDINTGSVPVAILNYKDARALDVQHGDRIKVKKGSKESVAILNISESKKAVAEGQIGLFEEMLDKLTARHKDAVTVSLIQKPSSVQHIRNKLFGKKLNPEQILEIVKDITLDNLTEIEKTYFVAACFIQKLDVEETVALARAILQYSRTFSFKGTVVDKHSVGGVPNNRVSMIVVPIVTAAGLIMPKISSRSITSAAGTADTMEVLAKVELTYDNFKKIVETIGGCIAWNGAMELVPADNKFIQVKHPLALDVEEIMVAAVMAEKAAVGSHSVVIEVPTGKFCKIQTEHKAKELSRLFIRVGKELGVKVIPIITECTGPVGKGVGPLFEAKDVMDILENKPGCALDLKEKGLFFAGKVLESAKMGDYTTAKRILESGQALAQMKRMIGAQGKKTPPAPGKYKYTIKAKKSGKVKDIDIIGVAKVARAAGAPHDKSAGLVMHVRKGDLYKKGQTLCVLYSQSHEKLQYARRRFEENSFFI